MRYKNFDIHIARKEDGVYSVEVRSESFGEVIDAPTFQISAAEIDDLAQRLGARQTDREFMIQTGTSVYQRLFSERAGVLFDRSQGEALSDADKGLRLRFHIRAPELASVPWELVYSPADDAFLATNVDTPLVRYLEMPVALRELATPLPLRALVVIPLGHDPKLRVDVDAERRAIEQSIQGFEGKVEFDYLHERFDDQRVTFQRVRERLAEVRYHCLHFVGHGTFRGDHGYIVLDGDGKDDIVEDDRFAQLFTNEPSMKLVFLNACKGAMSSTTQPLTGVAAQVVKRGVPAVVAMQFSVYDAAAVAFARAFYHSLFLSREPGRIDVAVARGRQALAVDFGDQRELAAPIVFTHTERGVLFHPETGRLLADLPKNRDALDTLEAAAAETGSAEELARFKRRIRTAKVGVGVAAAIVCAVFLASYVRLLDVFALDTRFEFLVMGLGNALADHGVSDDLAVVTIDDPDSTPAGTRQEMGRVLRLLDQAGAQSVVLALHYSSANGDFKNDPDSGHVLTATIEAVEVPVVIGAIRLREERLDIPDRLNAAAAGVGHTCVETKMGLARGLPMVYRKDQSSVPALALMGYVAYRGGLMTGDVLPTVVSADAPSTEFRIANIRRVAMTGPCEVAVEGDLALDRFLRRTPDALLARLTTSSKHVEEVLDGAPEHFVGKVVVVGLATGDGQVMDLQGVRSSVLWHADALNNLLLNEEILPIPRLTQFVVMLLLALAVVVLRLSWDPGSRATRFVVLASGSMLIVVVTVIGYGRYGILANPTYYLITFWLAWWVAGRYGRRWLD